MQIKNKSAYGVFSNLSGFFAIIMFIVINSGFQNLFIIGPSQNLFVLNVQVDTWYKYISLLTAVFVISTADTIGKCILNPVCGLIYNPNIERIFGFFKPELVFITNAHILVGGYLTAFKTLIIISRLELAIFSITVSSITEMIIINIIINEKTFYPSVDNHEEYLAARTIDVNGNIRLSCGLKM